MPHTGMPQWPAQNTRMPHTHDTVSHTHIHTHTHTHRHTHHHHACSLRTWPVPLHIWHCSCLSHACACTRPSPATCGHGIHESATRRHLAAMGSMIESMSDAQLPHRFRCSLDIEKKTVCRLKRYVRRDLRISLQEIKSAVVHDTTMALCAVIATIRAGYAALVGWELVGWLVGFLLPSHIACSSFYSTVFCVVLGFPLQGLPRTVSSDV